jgi:long-chain acyl-CoA synthetase
MRIVDTLLELQEHQSGLVAWVDRDESGLRIQTLSWRELKSLCSAAVLFLRDLHIGPKSRVVNLAPNSLAWVLLDLACSALNAVHVPLDPRLAAYHQECVEKIEPALIFAPQGTPFSDERLRYLNEIVQLHPSSQSLHDLCLPYSPKDVANILFTSGTTAVPKGVMLTHENLMANALAKLDAMPESQDDHRLNLLPFAHAYARTCELTTWLIRKSSMEVIDGIESLLRIAKLSRPTLINGVPSLYDRIDDLWGRSGYTLESLHEILGPNIRRLACGGARLNEGLRHRFAAVGLPIFQGYGLTEASPVVCSNRCASDTWVRDCVEGVGPPVLGVDVRIDEQSRLWVSGNGIMAGYWNDPVATACRLKDGWLDTGDLAEFILDEAANSQPLSIRILGRRDESIVLSNGYKIHPYWIEELLRSIDWVRDCFLLGNGRPCSILMISISRNDISCHDDQLLEEYCLDEVRKTLSNVPSYAIPRCVVPVFEDWRSDSELCSFKGGLRRSMIEARYKNRIESQYAKLGIKSESLGA